MTVEKEIDDQIFKNTLNILSDLIKFQTESGKSNLKLIEYCEKELKKSNAYSFKTFNNSKTQANLFSTIGGSTQVKDGGIIGGHDYRPEWKGVVKAVNEMLGEPMFTFIDGSWIKHKPKILI